MSLVLNIMVGIGVGYASTLVLCYLVERHRSAQPVVVEGLRLPQSLVRTVLRQRQRHYVAKEPFDAYGRFWWPGAVSLPTDVEDLGSLGPYRVESLTSDAQLFAHASEFWALDPGFI